ncbi:LapA family protein [Streptomyces mayteni]
MSPEANDQGPNDPAPGGGAGAGTDTAAGRPAGPGFWNTSRVVAALISVLVLVFIFQNTRTTKVHLLIPEVRLPLWVVLLGTAILGMLAGMFWSHHRRKRRARG